MTRALPIRYARQLLRLAPVPPDQLREELARLGLPRTLFDDEPGGVQQISAEDYGRLFMHLVKRMQPLLAADGAAAGESLAFSAYHMMFLAMSHARDLEEAMQRAAIYFRRFERNGDTFALGSEGRLACCRFRFTEDSRRMEMRAAETYDMSRLTWMSGEHGRPLSIYLWHRLCGWFIGCNIELEKVMLAQPRSAGSGDLQRHFDAPLEFDAPAYAFCFDRRYLAFPVVQGEAALRRMLQTYPAELLLLDEARNSMTAKVRGLLGSDFGGEAPTLQQVAARLLTTASTLHRRLREEGTSFQKIKNQLRRDLAVEAVVRGGQNLGEIAESLGFSDAGTFLRAFKTWTGKTPQAYGRAMRERGR